MLRVEVLTIHQKVFDQQTHRCKRPRQSGDSIIGLSQSFSKKGVYKVCILEHEVITTVHLLFKFSHSGSFWPSVSWKKWN